MSDENKSRAQLLAELEDARRRLAELQDAFPAGSVLGKSNLPPADVLGDVFDSIPVCIAYTDRDFNFLRVNRAYARADQKEPVDFLGENYFDLYPNAENETIFRRVVESGEPHFSVAKPSECAHAPERGVSFWEWSLIPVKDSDGRVATVVLSLMDVTQRTEAERTAQTYREAVESSSDLIAVVDAAYRCRLANKTYLDYLQVGADEVLGMPVVGSANKKAFEREMKPYIERGFEGESSYFEMDLLFPDKGQRHVAVTCSPIRSQTGKVSAVVEVIRDITPIAAAALRTKRAEARLSQAQALAQLGSYEFSTVSPSVHWDEQSYAVVGRDPRKGPPSVDEYFGEVMHPDDVEYTSAAIQSALETGEDYEGEYRVISEAGEVRWVHSIGQVLRNDDGQVVGMFGTIQNVTARHLAEEELRDRGELLRSISRAQPDIPIILDGDGRYIKILTGQKELLYRDEAALIGKTVHEVIPKDVADLALHAVKETIRTGLIQRVEYQLDVLAGRRWFEAKTSLLERGEDRQPYVVFVARDFTDRKMLENALRSGEDRWRTLFHGISDAVFVHEITERGRAGPFFEVNDAACSRLGYTRDELTGMNASQVIIEKHAVDDDEQLAGLPAGDTVTREQFLVAKDGSQVPVETRMTPFKVGDAFVVLSIARDISERLEAEESIKRERKRLFDVLENLPVFVCLRGPDDTIRFANRKFVEYFGDPADKTSRGIRYPDTAEESVYPQKDEQTDAHKWTDAEGRSFLIQHDEFSAGHGEQLVLETGVEITEMKRAEEAALAKSRLEATATLAGGFAHDINNLMVGVMGNAELLRFDHAGDRESASMLEEVVRSAKQAGELAQEMLAFSRQGRYMPRLLNINNVVIDALRGQWTQAPSGAHFIRQLDKSNATVYGDSAQIGMLVLNVLKNSVEAIRGRGEISVTTSRVRFEESDPRWKPPVEPGDYVLLAIKDDGEGMGPDVLRRIYEPMYSTRFTGRGMGMAASYGIVEQHDAHILVTSTIGIGTEVRVLFELHGESSGDRSSQPRSLPGGTETVLVVDDEPMVVRSTGAMLRRLGYQVLSAAGGRRAVEVATERGTEIDVVLLDMKMPLMSGFELFGRLKSIVPSVRVVICSGYDLDEDARSLLDSGAELFLKKPFSLSELGRSIRSVLDKEPHGT